MILKPAKNEDLPFIMQIVQDSQIHLALQHIDQWQNGYPNETAILKDIAHRESFVVKSESNEIMGTAMFTTKSEPTYSAIEGSWLTDKNVTYGVIHRMAVSDAHRKQGVAKFIFNKCEEKLKESKILSMRIDTHEDNTEMQGLLHHLGYVYCGVIFLDNADKRLAFEKLIT